MHRICAFSLSLLCSSACTPWLHGPNYWAADGRGGYCDGTGSMIRHAGPGKVSMAFGAQWQQDKESLDVVVWLFLPQGGSARFEERLITFADLDSGATRDYQPAVVVKYANKPEKIDFLETLSAGPHAQSYSLTFSIRDFKPRRFEVRTPPVAIHGSSHRFPPARYEWSEKRRPGLLWLDCG